MGCLAFDGGVRVEIVGYGRYTYMRDRARGWKLELLGAQLISVRRLLILVSKHVHTAEQLKGRRWVETSAIAPYEQSVADIFASLAL